MPTTSLTSETAALASNGPTCPLCGYDLCGLPAACTCPECGGAFDDDACARAVAAWYTSARALRLCGEPPEASRWLAQAGCARVARRRLLGGVLAPIIAATITLLLLNGFVIHTFVRTWWIHPNDPRVRSLARKFEREDRVLNFNLHLFEPTLAIPKPYLGSYEQAQRREATWDWPQPDMYALMLILTPITAGLFPAVAWLAVWFIARVLARERRPATVAMCVVALVWPSVAAFALLFVLLLTLASVSEFATAWLTNVPFGEWLPAVIALPIPISCAAAVLLGFRMLCPRRRPTFWLVRYVAVVPVLILPPLGWLGMVAAVEAIGRYMEW